MCTGSFPFVKDIRTPLPEFKRIMGQSPKLTFPEDIQIDPELKDLMTKLITHNEKDRINWDQFFQHPFVQKSLQSVIKYSFFCSK